MNELPRNFANPRSFMRSGLSGFKVESFGPTRLFRDTAQSDGHTRMNQSHIFVSFYNWISFNADDQNIGNRGQGEEGTCFKYGDWPFSVRGVVSRL